MQRECVVYVPCEIVVRGPMKCIPSEQNGLFCSLSFYLHRYARDFRKFITNSKPGVPDLREACRHYVAHVQEIKGLVL